MRRTTRNYIINAIFSLLMLFQGVSGFILWFLLPGGYRYRGGAGGGGDVDGTFLLARHDWLDVHKWAAVALLVMFAVHILVHWQWIIRMTKSYFRQGNGR